MINVFQVGVGPLGQKIVKYIYERSGIKLVAAVDSDPEKTGKDIGELCSMNPVGVTIEKDLSEAIKGRQVQVAVVSTVSSIKKIAPLISQIAALGIHIVTTCEELSYPWSTNPEISRQIDEVCKSHGVSCIGTGVNPGFLMDYLPLVFTSICQHVEKVVVTRVQDASHRRIPFQQKIGAGLNVAQFQKEKQNGTLRHVGLTESVNMIASGLRWKLDRVEDVLEPVLAEEPVNSGYRRIKPGQVRGVMQTGKGFVKNKEKIILVFKAAVGEGNPYDKVEIIGTPSFTSMIPGGINGDIATSAITVNMVGSILTAKPGLNTMSDIAVPSFFV